MADRKTFWPVVLTGAAAAALASVASGRAWATASSDVAGHTADAAAKGSDVAPLALALSLVALAAWGAVLVVRRRGRRVVSALGVLASAGVVVTVVSARERAVDDAVALVVGDPSGADASLTAWYYLAGAGGVLAAAMFVAAWLTLASWPEMAARYDAPGSRDWATDDTDLWKALDEGHDPTA